MRRWPNKRWYVAHTKPGQERMAEGHLERQGFHVYLPLREKKRRIGRRTDIIKAPLFPRYLFVELDLSVDRWRSVNGTFGVAYLVGGPNWRGGRPSRTRRRQWRRAHP